MSSLTSGADKKIVKIDIPNRLDFEKIPIAAVGVVAQKMGFLPEQIENLKTAMGEAVANAIEHGNQLNAETRVQVQLTVTGNRLVMQVFDEGLQPIPAIPTRRRAPAGVHRRWGFEWIKNFTDQVAVKAMPGCNEIKMIVYLNKAT